MVDMRYGAADLQAAGTDHGKVAESIEPLVVQVSRLDLPAGALGTMPAAAAFAAALDRARLTCSLALAQEADVRTQQSRRTCRTGAIGDSLTTQTTRTAQGAAPRTITPGPESAPGAIVRGMG